MFSSSRSLSWCEAILLVADERGHNTIIVVPGANGELSPEDVTAAQETLQSARVVVTQLEVSPSTTCAAMWAARSGDDSATWPITICNPAPARTDLHTTMFDATDILCPNETEAQLLTDMRVGSTEECEQVVRALLGKSVPVVVLTRGAHGAILGVQHDASTTATVRAIPCPPVPAEADVVDTVGAGDALVGGLAYFLSQLTRTMTSPRRILEDVDVLEDAIRRAMTVASASVTRKGAQSSFFDRAELPADLFQDDAR